MAILPQTMGWGASQQQKPYNTGCTLTVLGGVRISNTNQMPALSENPSESSFVRRVLALDLSITTAGPDNPTDSWLQIRFEKDMPATFPPTTIEIYFAGQLLVPSLAIPPPPPAP